MKPFEIIEHPADVGFMAYGGDLKELFQSAALALFSLGFEVADLNEPEHRVVIANGTDTEMLLYDWLAELLAVGEVEQVAFRRAVVTELTGTSARGIAYGEKYSKVRHTAGTHIKAVTMHQFHVEQREDGTWTARVFLDL